jgi:hypothetical protein
VDATFAGEWPDFSTTFRVIAIVDGDSERERSRLIDAGSIIPKLRVSSPSSKHRLIPPEGDTTNTVSVTRPLVQSRGVLRHWTSEKITIGPVARVRLVQFETAVIERCARRIWSAKNLQKKCIEKSLLNSALCIDILTL